MKIILDDKGHVIGREVNGNMLDGQGRMTARYIKSSDRTVDDKGHKVGVGDQRLRELGK
jgi:hypothetical protein